MLSFPQGFVFGTATSSYQIEGGAVEHGKGESIWDRFSHTAGKIGDQSNGDVACDHYHRYAEDVSLMRELGIGAYRLSVAWPRIYPSGGGKINRDGLDFYGRLVDALLEAGIEPCVTLYHWDLPQALQERGGWVNRDTAAYFTEYANAVLGSLGDRVGRWITINEPWVVSMMGYGNGMHAPGISDHASALQASHVLHLAHASVVGLFRHDFANSGDIGITLNLSPIDPETDEDRDAAQVADGFLNRWFLDPVFRGTYPEDMADLYSKSDLGPDIQEGDMDLIAGTRIDFLGVNYYNRHVARRSVSDTLGYTTIVPEGAPVTAMEWEIHPPGLYDLLTRLHTDYDEPALFITENGAAFEDTTITDEVVQDADRIDYLHGHLAAAWRAIQEGVNLRGYYLWSFMDNFEWAYGHSKRFGIVRVDYNTLERTPKKSAHWYRDVINRHGVDELS